MARKGGLGKGLSALMEDNSTQSGVTTLRISEIEPNKNQPRKFFDDELLAGLADSIKEKGILQPLIVRALNIGTYQIVAGERRFRAARMVGLEEIPVIIKDFSDEDAAEVALIENLQREDLNPIEEALGYSELLDRYNLTQDEVAKKVGKSRPAVANSLRLLNLPDEVIKMVQSGKISSGHARALLGLENKDDIIELAKQIVSKDLTVRDIENFIRLKKQNDDSSKKDDGSKKTMQKGRDSYFDEMEIALKDELHRKIKIDFKGNKGTLQIEFYNKEELSDIAGRLSRQ